MLEQTYFLNFGSNTDKLIANSKQNNWKPKKPTTNQKSLRFINWMPKNQPHTKKNPKPKQSRQSNPDWSTVNCTSDDILFRSSCLQVPEVVIPDTVCSWAADRNLNFSVFQNPAEIHDFAFPLSLQLLKNNYNPRADTV